MAISYLIDHPDGTNWKDLGESDDPVYIPLIQNNIDGIIDAM